MIASLGIVARINLKLSNETIYFRLLKNISSSDYNMRILYCRVRIDAIATIQKTQQVKDKKTNKSNNLLALVQNDWM